MREALRLLQAQGVVRDRAESRHVVTGFTVDELHEMFQLRLAVERIALRRIIERRTPKALIASQLSVAIEAMRRAAKIGDRLALCQADCGSTIASSISRRVPCSRRLEAARPRRAGFRDERAWGDLGTAVVDRRTRGVIGNPRIRFERGARCAH